MTDPRVASFTPRPGWQVVHAKPPDKWGKFSTEACSYCGAAIKDVGNSIEVRLEPTFKTYGLDGTNSFSGSYWFFLCSMDQLDSCLLRHTFNN